MANIVHVYHFQKQLFYKYWKSKKITCPGALDKLNFRQDKHTLSPNVQRASKNFSASLFFLEKDKLFGNSTSKTFDDLGRATSENFKIFLPLIGLYLMNIS